MPAMIARSLQWKAVFQSTPMAAMRPSGGTTTATSVTTWLIRLVLGRTVPTAASLTPIVNRNSVVCEYRSVRVAVIGSGSSAPGTVSVCSRAREVQVFQPASRGGGQSSTVSHRALAPDPALLVHNEPNNPLLCRLVCELGVAGRVAHATRSSSSPGEAPPAVRAARANRLPELVWGSVPRRDPGRGPHPGRWGRRACREPRVADRPVVPLARNAEARALHGESGAVALPGPALRDGEVRHLPDRARRWGPGPDLAPGRAAARGRGARDVSPGYLPSLSAAPLPPRRCPAGARDGRAACPRGARRHRKGAPPRSVQGRPSTREGAGRRADRGRAGAADPPGRDGADRAS